MGILEALGQAIWPLFRRLLPRSMELLERVKELLQRGEPRVALELIEEYLQVEPSMYLDRSDLETHLERILTAEVDVLAAGLLQVWATTLGLLARPADGLTVLEIYTGVSVRPDFDGVRLASELAALRAKQGGDISFSLVLLQVGLLGMLGRHAEGLRLIELDLGLSPSTNREALMEALHSRWAELSSDDLIAAHTMGVAGAYSVCGRDQEARWVVEAFLEIPSTNELDAMALGQHARQRLSGLDAEAAAAFLHFASAQLQEVSVRGVGSALLEAHLGISPALYQEPDLLRERVEHFLPRLLPVNGASYLLGLAVSLARDERPADALALLEALSGKSPEETRRYLAGLPADIEGTWVRSLSAARLACGQPREAVAGLRGYLEIEDRDFGTSVILARRLGAALSRFTDPVRGGIVYDLLSGLRTSGETDQANRLAETYVEAFADLEERGSADHAFVGQAIPIYCDWLATFGRDASRGPLDVCRKLVTYLRLQLVGQGVQLGDRLDFVRYTNQLRQEVATLGHTWSRTLDNPEQRQALQVEALCWDAELSQRLLIERLLLERLPTIPRGESPVSTWPWDEERPTWSSHLSDRLALGRCPGDLEASVSEFRSSREPSAGVRWEALEPEVVSELRRTLAEGVREEHLVRALGPTGLLLRTTFSASGQLLWSATRARGACLTVVASGEGKPGDRQDIQWAVARHDMRMAWARAGADPRRSGSFASAAKEVAQALDEIEAELMSPRAAEQLPERLEWLWCRYVAPEGADQGIRHQILIPLLSALASGLGEIDSATSEIQRLRRQFACGPSSSIDVQLEEITAEYLEELGDCCQLDALFKALHPDDDLILQADDVLLELPVSCLPTGSGQRVFQRVRSVRSSMSLLLSSLAEREPSASSPAAACDGKLVCVSSFDLEDPARSGAVDLHHGLERLAAEFGLGSFGAADQPLGTPGVLRAAVAELHSIRVLAVCGHGDFFQSGIALPPTRPRSGPTPRVLWQGEGCDFRHVDWLWLVSCSLGRLAENGYRDLEGFCVRLALHRAKSIAAYRWPVNSVEAAALAAHSTWHYLRLREVQHADEANPRARALNAARLDMASGNEAEGFPRISLRTLAACELYGMG